MPKNTSTGRRSGVTLIYDTGEREDDALQRLEWVVPVVFLAALLILFFAAVEWMSPALPTLLFFVVVWFPVSLFLAWKSLRGGTELRNVGLAVGMLALFGLPLMAWGAGPYRAAVLWAIGDLMPIEATMAAVGDDSDSVSSIACGRALQSEEPRRIQRVSSVLETRPAVAMSCLEDLDSEQRGARSRIAGHLHETWYTGWMTEAELDEEVGCQGAAVVPELAQMHGGNSVPDLLMCALGAQTPEFAKCCGESLSDSAEMEAILDVRPWAWSRDFDEALFLALSEAVDMPATTLMGSDPVSDSLQWTPADLFHWTTHLGCHLVNHHERADSMAAQLSKTIDTQCGLDVEDPLFSFTAVQFVQRTCDAAVVRGDAERVDVVEWCDAGRVANRETAVDSARFVVDRAVATFGLDDLQRTIVSGGYMLDASQRHDPIFSVESLSSGGSDSDVGTDGVRLGRPEWADHTAESHERLQDVRQDRQRRREEVGQQIETSEDVGDAERERTIDREVSNQVRDELRQMRGQRPEP